MHKKTYPSKYTNSLHPPPLFPLRAVPILIRLVYGLPPLRTSTRRADPLPRFSRLCWLAFAVAVLLLSLLLFLFLFLHIPSRCCFFSLHKHTSGGIYWETQTTEQREFYPPHFSKTAHTKHLQANCTTSKRSVPSAFLSCPTRLLSFIAVCPFCSKKNNPPPQTTTEKRTHRADAP